MKQTPVKTFQAKPSTGWLAAAGLLLLSVVVGVSFYVVFGSPWLLGIPVAGIAASVIIIRASNQYQVALYDEFLIETGIRHHRQVAYKDIHKISYQAWPSHTPSINFVVWDKEGNVLTAIPPQTFQSNLEAKTFVHWIMAQNPEIQTNQAIAQLLLGKRMTLSEIKRAVVIAALGLFLAVTFLFGALSIAWG